MSLPILLDKSEFRRRSPAQYQSSERSALTNTKILPLRDHLLDDIESIVDVTSRVSR
jgi:hypothetical protein